MKSTPILLAASVFAACSSPICDPAELTAALASAASGDTIELGACRIEGAFTIPPGVAISGEGPASTTLVSTAADRAALRMETGEAVTRIAHLALVSSSPAGVYSMGAGSIAIEDVEVTATLGAAIAADGVAHAALANVVLRGPVTPANETSIPIPATAMQTATHGLVLVGVRDAQLDAVSVRGFASFGALVVDSTTAWSLGDADENLRVGAMFDGGRATLENVSLSGTLKGGRPFPSFAGVFTSSVALETSRLVANENSDYVLLHDHGSARHVGLTANDNAGPAVYAQNVGRLEVSGNMALNDLAGVIAIDSIDVFVHDAQIGQTRVQAKAQDDGSIVQAGDGIHLVRSQPAHVADVALEGNGRVGLLVELGGRAFGMTTIERVAVTATDPAQSGAVVQNGVVPPNWDASVMRSGVTAGEDAMIAGTLGALGAVGPCGRPRSAARAIGARGVLGL